MNSCSIMDGYSEIRSDEKFNLQVVEQVGECMHEVN